MMTIREVIDGLREAAERLGEDAMVCIAVQSPDGRHIGTSVHAVMFDCDDDARDEKVYIATGSERHVIDAKTAESIW